MKLLLVVLALTLLAACPSAGPHPILTDRVQASTGYRYAAVDQERGKAIEALIDRAEIVSRYANKSRVSYVVQDTQLTRHKLGTMPFQPLERVTLVVRVSRVSDINGWGTGANGEIHRDTTLKLDIPRGKLAEAFTLLQKLESAPRATIESVWPTSLASIETKKAVALFERGYELSIQAQLVTGNPFDASTRVSLYGLEKRTDYTLL